MPQFTLANRFGYGFLILGIQLALRVRTHFDALIVNFEHFCSELVDADRSNATHQVVYSSALGVGGQDDLANLFPRDDFGQGVFVLEFEHRQDVPITWAGGSIEELDAGESDAERSVGRFFLVAEVEEVSTQFCFRDLVGCFAAMIGQLSDGA